ncbi:NUDIX domain-containing protein [Aquirufa sp.]|jgi:ADP-ribose pyrophosphatase YjhB (NUDIX family)|uniref:NUDIX domain-containing protein n=1 Tax=Aquirufa sp. TaxID=2676249 RepID=UPI00378468E5
MRIRPAALIIENNHVLFLRYDYPGGSKFALPGGNVDAGETFPVTIARECEEELGIEVEVHDLLFTCQVHATDDYSACAHLIFEGDIVGGIPLIQAGETTADDLVWVPVDKIAELTIYPSINDAILDYVHTGKKGQYLGTLKQIWL